jgi:hypothetical protein
VLSSDGAYTCQHVHSVVALGHTLLATQAFMNTDIYFSQKIEMTGELSSVDIDVLPGLLEYTSSVLTKEERKHLEYFGGA